MLEARSTTPLARSLANRVLSEVIEDQTGPAGYLDRNTGLETLIDANTGLGSFDMDVDFIGSRGIEWGFGPFPLG